jgi:hypothetical protein
MTRIAKDRYWACDQSIRRTIQCRRQMPSPKCMSSRRLPFSVEDTVGLAQAHMSTDKGLSVPSGEEASIWLKSSVIVRAG